MLLTVQGQRTWNVAFVTISPTHTKLHNIARIHALTFHVASIITINSWVPVTFRYSKHEFYEDPIRNKIFRAFRISAINEELKGKNGK